jgi:hypothetical protein
VSSNLAGCAISFNNLEENSGSADSCAEALRKPAAEKRSKPQLIRANCQPAAIPPSHGGNTGSNPVGDANLFSGLALSREKRPQLFPNIDCALAAWRPHERNLEFPRDRDQHSRVSIESIPLTAIKLPFAPD